VEKIGFKPGVKEL